MKYTRDIMKIGNYYVPKSAISSLVLGILGVVSAVLFTLYLFDMVLLKDAPTYIVLSAILAAIVIHIFIVLEENSSLVYKILWKHKNDPQAQIYVQNILNLLNLSYYRNLGGQERLAELEKHLLRHDQLYRSILVDLSLFKLDIVDFEKYLTIEQYTHWLVYSKEHNISLYSAFNICTEQAEINREKY